VHIAELATAVVKVDIKAINASLCVTPPLMHVEMPRPRDASELNNDGMIKFGNVYYQTKRILSIFSKEI